MMPFYPEQNSKVYMAGPVQHAPDAAEWREELATGYDGFEWVNPLDKYSTLENTHIECMEMEPAAREMAQCGDVEVVRAEEIVRSDIEMIEACDAVLARLDGSPMTGTPMEMRIAYAELNIPVVVWRVDNEPSPWSWCHSDAVRTSQRDTIQALTSLLNGGDPNHDPSGLPEPGP